MLSNSRPQAEKLHADSSTGLVASHNGNPHNQHTTRMDMEHLLSSGPHAALPSDLLPWLTLPPAAAELLLWFTSRTAHLHNKARQSDTH
jgi:hypothetical protein